MKKILTSAVVLACAVLAPVLAGLTAPASAGVAREVAREARSSYVATAHFGAPQPARIGRTCVIPKFRWMVATNAPSDAVFGGTATVLFKGETYGESTLERFSVNRWQGVQMFRPVCEPGRYRIKISGEVYAGNRPYGDVPIYRRVAGGATYVIR